MGCCAKYAAKLILSLSALAFLALSVVLMYVSVSAFDSPFFEGVVAAVAVGGVVLSLLTAVVACTGCAALLSCKRPRTWLALYLLFDLLVAAGLVGLTWWVFNQSAAVSSAASAAKGAPPTETETADTLEKLLGSSISAIVSACNNAAPPNVTATGAGSYTVSCDGKAWLGGQITELCFGPDNPVNASAGGAFAACYADPRGGAAAPLNASLAARLATPRGIFCQCAGDLAGFVAHRLWLVQLACVLGSALFLLAFCGGAYLCTRHPLRPLFPFPEPSTAVTCSPPLLGTHVWRARLLRALRARRRRQAPRRRLRALCAPRAQRRGRRRSAIRAVGGAGARRAVGARLRVG